MAGRRGTGAVLAAAALIALVAVFFIGRASAGGGQATPPTAPGSADPGPTRTDNGVPVGYAHTRAGVVAATLNYGAVLAGPRFLKAAQRRAALAVLGTAAYARTVERSSAPALRELERGPLGQGLRQGHPTLYEGAPLGYRVQQYTGDRAVVQVWGLALVGNTVAIRPQAAFQTTTSTLVWQNGDWKLAAGNNRDGPTVALAPDATPTPADALLSFTARLQGLHYAP